MTDDAHATDVLVLGGGVSGLAAAACLTQAGCTVRVLDARDHVGGRVRSLRGDRWPVPVDLGAEFVQGLVPELFSLAEEAGLPVVELGGARWQSRAGQLTRSESSYAHMDEVLGRLPRLGAQDDQSVDEFLASTTAGDAPAEARALARSWIESYDAADPGRFSVRALVRERTAERKIAGHRAFRVVTGYDGVPGALLARIPPHRGRVDLETIATEVHWTPGALRVEARGPLGDPRGPFTAQRLVVALPVGVLKASPNEPGAVRFTPALTQKTEALRGLEMGHVVKLLLAFKERFWTRLFPAELGFLSTFDEPFQAWWTGYPLYAPVLVAWAGGSAADALTGLTLEQRVDRALDSLAHVLRLPRADVDRQVVAWHTHDWAADPYARGAYSYVLVGGMEAQAEFARPVENTLFFAGEATELDGHQATVHGALFSGQRAADEVLGSLGIGPGGRHS